MSSSLSSSSSASSAVLAGTPAPTPTPPSSAPPIQSLTSRQVQALDALLERATFVHQIPKGGVCDYMLSNATDITREFTREQILYYLNAVGNSIPIIDPPRPVVAPAAASSTDYPPAFAALMASLARPPTPPPAGPVYQSPFPELPRGNTPLSPLSSRHVDRIGSFLDNQSLGRLNQTSRGARWTLQARTRMRLYYRDPSLRERETGPSQGLAIVYRARDQQPRLMKIVRAAGRLVTETMTAVLTDTNDSLGTIRICWLRPNGYDGTRYGHEGNRAPSFSPYRDRPRDEYCGQEIYIENVDGTSSYSGVGTALMQAGGMELGLIEGRDCNMRLWFNSVRDSHGFYWSLGMRHAPVDHYRDTPLATRIVSLWKQGKKRLEEDFGGTLMHLPPGRATTEWRSRVRQDPILDATRAASH